MLQRNRVTVVENVYFTDVTEGNSTTLPIESRFARTLQTDELPFQRKFKATSEWKPLPGIADWLDGQCSMLVIQNVEGLTRDSLRIPTEAELVETAGRVIELGLESSDGTVTPFAAIPPNGESIRLTPENILRWCVRSPSGVAAYWLHALPA